MGVWNELVTARMSSHVITEHPTGADVDADLAVVETPALQLAEVLALALAAYGISIPATDLHAAAVLSRDGTAADPALLTRGTVVALTDGRLGYACGRGAAIESAGEAVTRVTTPEPGRYVAAWYLPGVNYVRGTG